MSLSFVFQDASGGRVELSPHMEWSGDDFLANLCRVVERNLLLDEYYGPSMGSRQHVVAAKVAKELGLEIVERPAVTHFPDDPNVCYGPR
jgi:hypothetical protein